MPEKRATAKPSLAGRLLAPDVEHLSPAYFGMAMATGIVAIAARQEGLWPLDWALFGFDCAVYVVLWWLLIVRIWRFPLQVFEDVIDHMRGPGFFTTVAAAAIMGSCVLIFDQWVVFGFVFWLMTAALWLLLTYTIFTAFTVKEHKPTLDRGITGAWLLAVVATQAVAVLAAHLATHLQQPHRVELNFIALSMWLWGGMLYIWMMSLIFYRYTFFPFSPGDLAPPYWINMGAMAISTLAGSLLIENSADAWFLHSVAPFMKGFTIFYWATGTWWIPMLLILGVWRHIYRRFPLGYDPLYWGAVFPLGMYAVATHQMAQALQFDFLEPLAGAFVWISLGAWALTAFGWLQATLRGGVSGAWG